MTKASQPKARIEVFRTGTFVPMSGDPITYSAADLAAIADAYDPATAPAPVVIGHPNVDAPAYAWAESFEWDATAGRLFATLGEIEPAFAEAVKAGRYKKVSLSFHRPDASANPVPGAWYPKHIGFLGGAAPAVAGLKNIQFAADPADATFEFAERGFEETASILRSLRDFFIERFGLDEADKALPGYRLDWLAETEVQPQPGPQPAFSTPPTTPPVKEPAVTIPTDPAFAAREADLKARHDAVVARERELAHTGNVAFAETLVTGGRLIAASKDKVVALLDALPSETAVSFADGGATKTMPIADALRDILSAQPVVVNYGRADMPAEGGDGGSASFAADGKSVDRDQLAIHEKALVFQAQHPGTDYLAAVRAVK